MKKNACFLVALLIMLFVGCSKDDVKNELEDNIYTIVGNTYIANKGRFYPFVKEDIYLIYTFKSDKTIDIDERLGSKDGELRATYYGKYEYNHPKLKLDIYNSPKDCPDCVNHFEAVVSDDFKSFEHEVYYLIFSEFKTIVFKLK